jgi:hypothetical protein
MVDAEQLEPLSFEAARLAAEIRHALTRLVQACPEARRVMAEADVLLERLGELAPAVLLEAMRAAAVSTADIPHWDSRRRVLSVGGQTVKRYHVPAPNQEAVLDAFQREGWPDRIDDPLPFQAGRDSKNRQHFTINRLNQNQQQQLIRFFGDGTGEGVCWELSEVASLPRPVAISQKARRAA